MEGKVSIDQSAIQAEIDSQSKSDTSYEVESNSLNRDSKDFFLKEVAGLNIEQGVAFENLDRLRRDNTARRKFSLAIFFVTVSWMGLIITIVIASGLKYLILSDAVLIALITTTTANVFGFLYVVVNYLFNKDKST